MALIDNDLIDKIRKQNDIVEVIGSYIPLTEKGKNYFCVCPFHDDHSPSMSVSTEKQIYKCFSCGATGNVFSFVMNYENLSFVEAVSLLGEKIGIKINNNAREVNNKYEEDYNIYKTSLMFYKNNLKSSSGTKAVNYLHDRGLKDEDIEYFDIGLSTNANLSDSLKKKYDKKRLVDLGLSYESNGMLSDLFKNRIMFPIDDLKGSIVGYSGRIYNNEDTSKYVNTRETRIFKKGKLFYNYSRARDAIKRKKEVIICEGQMDVIRLHTIGINNAIALMGTSFTSDQLNIVKKLNSEVTLNLDRDSAGMEATYKIGNELTKIGISPKVIVFSGAKDTDEYIVNNGNEAFKKVYSNKISFIDFKIDYLKKNKDLKDSVDLSKYINEIISELNLIEDKVLLELKVKELSSRYDINEETIYSKIGKKTFERKPVVKKPEIKRYNKYEISEIRIIYLMLNNEKLIRIYEKELGYLPSLEMKNLANEVVYFKDFNKGFDYADFITHIESKPNLKKAYEKVINYDNIDTYSDEEIDDYVITIKKANVMNRIERLKQQMKETLDINEKLNLAARIEKMKKDVMEW